MSAKKLVDFRSAVMSDFHENPSRALNIKKPTAAHDIIRSLGDYSLKRVRSLYAKDGDAVQSSMKNNHGRTSKGREVGLLPHVA